MVAKITISGAIGGNPGPPSSSWAAAAAVAADELVDMALKVSQELVAAAAVRALALRARAACAGLAVGRSGVHGDVLV